MPDRRANNNKAAPTASPPPVLENQQLQAAGAEAAAFVSPQPPQQGQPLVLREFVTSPGHRLNANFEDLVGSIRARVAEPFKEFEAEMQNELSALRGLTDDFRASRAESEASLRRSKSKLNQLKASLLELDDDDCDADDDNRNEADKDDDLFGDADAVAGRSPGRFSDPPTA